ncbi:MAG: hypothetical protein AXW12_00465 [Thalassospira sp. Nap_22]|nr:MAG: hypothetical protein AXW12_00465 [Thalassospira sp. Nap_22]
MTQRKAIVEVFELSDLDTGQRTAKRAGWTHIAQGMVMKDGSSAGKLTKADVENAARAIIALRDGEMPSYRWEMYLDLYYKACAKTPEDLGSHGMVRDAMREAKAVIKSLGLEVMNEQL